MPGGRAILIAVVTQGIQQSGQRAMQMNAPMLAVRFSALVAALSLNALIPSMAFGQTEACSFPHPLNGTCQDLDPSTCVSLGGNPLGPGTRCPVGRGTIFGDLDADDAFDSLDTYAFALALLDPAEYAAEFPIGNINLADFNTDGAIDGLDVQLFVSGIIFLPCIYLPGHAGTNVAAPATGCAATLDTCETQLCLEPVSTALAASEMWVGVAIRSPDNPNEALIWAQTGYTRSRSSHTQTPSTTVTVKVYFEVVAGPQETDRRFRVKPEALTPGAHSYHVYQISPLFGHWYADFDDDIAWVDFAHNNWRNLRADLYEYQAEVWNVQDLMIGTPSNHCQFQDCEFEQNFGGPQPANIAPADVWSQRPSLYGASWVAVNALEVWDKRR